MIYYPTVKARYSLSVLKVPLNPKQTNKQTMHLFADISILKCSSFCIVLTDKFADVQALSSCGDVVVQPQFAKFLTQQVNLYKIPQLAQLQHREHMSP